MPIHDTDTDTAIRMSRRAAPKANTEALLREGTPMSRVLRAPPPTEDERAGHQGGWTGALTHLERLFEPRSTP